MWVSRPANLNIRFSWFEPIIFLLSMFCLKTKGNQMPEIVVNENNPITLEAARDLIKTRHPDIASYDTPWWGNKQTESGNLNNRGYVIGFRNTAKQAQWRLDYDEKKGLHINWTQEVKGSETTKECYLLSSTRPQDTLYDYYVGWTRPRSDEIPAEIKAALDKVGGTKTWNGRYWGA